MFKDQVLDKLAQHGNNTAQFVSYGPDGKQRYLRIRGVHPTHRFASIEKAIQAILDTGAPFVNIRTYRPERPENNPFPKGRKEKWPTVVDIADVVRGFLKQKLYVIVNEDINIGDGGFSGVVMGDMAEFAPCDTPRCVDAPGCAKMSRSLMDRMAQVVYGRRIGFPYSRNHRIEFSTHPGPVGYLRHSQIVWQEEPIEHGTAPTAVKPRWPNRYSEAMGDKAFGLLMAHLSGLSVPHSRVSGRIIPPFEFGEPTGSQEERVVRSCPRVPTAGAFFTSFGWLDIVDRMQREDESGDKIASYIEQDRVDAQFSGGALTDAAGKPVIEGKAGTGASFMLGSAKTSELPVYVIDQVRQLWERASEAFGPVRFEWVYDVHNRLWLMQLHAEESASLGNIIYPGTAEIWKPFQVPGDLETFRGFVMQAVHEGFGIVLKGDVGITSHFGDILRTNRIPSRLER